MDVPDLRLLAGLARQRDQLRIRTNEFINQEFGRRALRIRHSLVFVVGVLILLAYIRLLIFVLLGLRILLPFLARGNLDDKALHSYAGYVEWLAY